MPRRPHRHPSPRRQIRRKPPTPRQLLQAGTARGKARLPTARQPPTQAQTPPRRKAPVQRRHRRKAAPKTRRRQAPEVHPRALQQAARPTPSPQVDATTSTNAASGPNNSDTQANPVATNGAPPPADPQIPSDAPAAPAKTSSTSGKDGNDSATAITDDAATAAAAANAAASTAQPVAAAIAVATPVSMPAPASAVNSTTAAIGQAAKGAARSANAMTAAQSAAAAPDASDAGPTDQAPAVATAGGGSDKGTAAPAATTAKMQATSGSAVQQAQAQTQTQGQATDTAPLASAQTDASAPVNSDHASARAANLSGASSSSAGATSNTQNGAAGTKTDANGAVEFRFLRLSRGHAIGRHGFDIIRRASTAAAVPVAGLAVAIAARAQSGSNQFDIRLDPPELGRIDVRLDVDRDGQVTSHMTVERADTLQLLQSQQPQIEQALQQAGLKTADNGLQFTLRDQSFTGAEQRLRCPDQHGSAQVVIPDADLAADRRDANLHARRVSAAGSTSVFERQSCDEDRAMSTLQAINTGTSAIAQLANRPVQPSSSSSSTARATGTNASQQLAGNFDTFLQLLTTQLQNQDPLDPLDTNQFTQQLVEFASVEQQINMNTNLQTLISMQQTTEATSALQLVGSTVTVSGNSATLSNATGSRPPGASTRPRRRPRNVTITSSTGHDRLYRNAVAQCRHPKLHLERQGQQRRDMARRHLHAVGQRDRRQRPAGHCLDARCKASSARVNISQNPPTLTVGGQSSRSARSRRSATDNQRASAIATIVCVNPAVCKPQSLAGVAGQSAR